MMSANAQGDTKQESAKGDKKQSTVNPVKVAVEYCSACGYGGSCHKLSKLIKIENPKAEVSCTKGRKGSFEISVNDVPVYSKLQTRSLPNFLEVMSLIKSVSEGGPISTIKSDQSFSCVIS